MGQLSIETILIDNGSLPTPHLFRCKDDYDDPTAMDAGGSNGTGRRHATIRPVDGKSRSSTAVIGNDFDPVTTALINRLNLIANEIGDDVKAVIIDGALIPS